MNYRTLCPTHFNKFARFSARAVDRAAIAIIGGVIAFLCVMLVSGAVLWALAVVLSTWTLLRPGRLTPARAMARLGRMSPSEIGLRYEECDFIVCDEQSRERLQIVGWWVEALGKSDRSVVIVHGYADSRAGALAWAPVWLDIGFNALLIDLRAHGESGGTFTAAGLAERFDLQQVISELRVRKPAQTQQMMLFGASLGATIALAAAEVTPDIAGVVIDSPVADFCHGVATQSWLMGLPGSAVIRPGLWLAELWLGQHFSIIRPVDVIRRLNAPVLAILPSDDPFLPPAQATEIRTAIETLKMADGVSQVIDFEGATHLLSAHLHANQYSDVLNRFVNACTPDRLARAPAEGAAAGQAN